MSPHTRPFLTGLVPTLAAALAALGLAAAAADEPPKAEAPAKPMVKKHMKTKEPMAGEMKKEGMTKGDMKKAAEKKEKVMKEPMAQEEKKMKSITGTLK